MFGILHPPEGATLYDWPQILEERHHADFMTNGLLAFIFGITDSEREWGYCCYLVVGSSLKRKDLCDEECARHGLIGKPHVHAAGFGGSNEDQAMSCLIENLSLSPRLARQYLKRLPWWIATGDEEQDGFHWNIGWPDEE